MSLAELLVEDDLGISVDPATYQDQANPAPPLPGNYRLVVVGKVEPRKDKAGQMVLTDGKFPTLVLMRAKIVEPTEAEKEFSLFADIRTKPQDRFGSVASDLGDIIRSMDQTRAWSGLKDGLNVFEELLAQNTPFACQLGWGAYDSAYVDAEFDKLGIAKDDRKGAIDAGRITKDASNAIYKAARLNNKNFPVIERNGVLTLQHVAKGPSGAMLEAKPQIKKFFPSLETVNLGQFRLKA